MFATACATVTPPEPPPPPRPPTPTSITREHPGGDADDPERAALERLLREPWADRWDRFRSMQVSLMDSHNWQQVRLMGHPTRAAYRFGDEHYGVTAVWYLPTKDRDDPDSCLKAFIDQAQREADSYGMRTSQSELLHLKQQAHGEKKSFTLSLVEGTNDTLVSESEYIGAISAQQSWPGTCLIQGFAVVAGKHRALATNVRDRWVREGARGLHWARHVKEAPSFDAR